MTQSKRIYSSSAAILAIVLASALPVGCTTPRKADPIIFYSVSYDTRENFPPTSSIQVYWGSEEKRISKKYWRIAYSQTMLPGELFQFKILPSTTTKSFDKPPGYERPDEYRRKAMEIGANALLISAVQQSTKTWLTQYSIIHVTIMAIRFEEQ